jgi:hypothetical protein
VVVGQPTLRSVDSKREGRAIEPRETCHGEAERRRQCGGNIEALQWSCAEIPPGSEERWQARKGFTQEPGRPDGLRGNKPEGSPATKDPGPRA